jgi:hypothetical protein
MAQDYHMRKSDISCPRCSFGYKRLELFSLPGKSGDYRCLVCGCVLEVFDGSREIAYRLTAHPVLSAHHSRNSNAGDYPSTLPKTTSAANTTAVITTNVIAK